MEYAAYDPYYRDFPSSLLPARTPFTRAGERDAGHVFIYITHRLRRWSLLLDKMRTDAVYGEAKLRIPRSIAQLWLLEKCYSTRWPNPGPGRQTRPNSNGPGDRDLANTAGILVVLREPYPHSTRQGDVLSYHLEKADALDAAEQYSRLHHRRAVVGRLLWDEMWL